ncbi:hypothetical protein TWF173_002050 [Orbilia oligospora]|nr:hypothetical protein TWF173_002050 [Orbilia oligospora]
MLHILADVFMQQGPTSSGLVARVAGSPCLAFEYAETACCPEAVAGALEHAAGARSSRRNADSVEAVNGGRKRQERQPAAGKAKAVKAEAVKSRNSRSRIRSRSSGIGPDIS